MDIVVLTLGFFTAYLLGSTPTAVWFGKLAYGLDVRDHGSGNPGATNTFRVLGKRAGIIVMLVDICKGLLATAIATRMVMEGMIQEVDLVTYQLLFGITAVAGHIFSVFINFKGGKGVATLLGMMVGIHYEVALVCVAIFLLVLLTTKYVSLGSIIGALAFPTLLIFIPRFQTSEPLLVFFGFFLAIVIIWTHQKNIKRLRQGSEAKTYLIPRKK